MVAQSLRGMVTAKLKHLDMGLENSATPCPWRGFPTLNWN